MLGWRPTYFSDGGKFFRKQLLWKSDFVFPRGNFLPVEQQPRRSDDGITVRDLTLPVQRSSERQTMTIVRWYIGTRVHMLYYDSITRVHMLYYDSMTMVHMWYYDGGAIVMVSP